MVNVIVKATQKTHTLKYKFTHYKPKLGLFMQSQ